MSAVDTTSAEYMHQCLVRHVLKMRAARGGSDCARDFLDGWEKKHPSEKTLRSDVMDQWGRGNRGADGDWRS